MFSHPAWCSGGVAACLVPGNMTDVHRPARQAEVCRNHSDSGCVEAPLQDVTGVINKLETAAPSGKDYLHQEYDVSGRVLEHGLDTRNLDMEFFQKMKDYEKVPRKAAARDVCRVISTKWLDIKRGDVTRNFRATLVGRETKLDSRLDLFAATHTVKSSRPYNIITVKANGLAIEDFGPTSEQQVGRPNWSLYVARDARQNWTREYTEFFKNISFRAALAS